MPMNIERINEVYEFLSGFLDESKRTQPAYLTLKDGSTRLFRGEALDFDTQSQTPSSASSNDGSKDLITQSESGNMDIPLRIGSKERRNSAAFSRKTQRKSSRSGKNRRQSHRKNRK